MSSVIEFLFEHFLISFHRSKMFHFQNEEIIDIIFKIHPPLEPKYKILFDNINPTIILIFQNRKIIHF